MRIFEPGDIVRAPFPYTDRDTVQYRPALIVSRNGLGPRGALYWAVMITSAEHRPWPHDVPVGDDHEAIGLPIPSVIRPAKIAAVDAARIAAVSRLPAETMARVVSELSSMLGGAT
jgi:mRNA interferase MazF